MKRTVYSTAAVVEHFTNPTNYWRSWERTARTAARNLRTISAKGHDLVPVDFSKFTPQKYLLSHATIVGGVEMEKAPNSHYIIAPHGKWINDNGNAWANQVLLESYRSFIWAENYLEHIQLPVLSKGKILDAVAWVLMEHEKGVKEPVPTVFIDILVATNRVNHRLVNDILSSRINSMSMGCDISHFQCSRCGGVFEEGEDDPCEHITERLGENFKGKDGKKHRTAEMCGVPGHVGSCEFREASWVKVPAFGPAVRHDSLRVGEMTTGRPIRAFVPRKRIQTAARET